MYASADDTEGEYAGITAINVSSDIIVDIQWAYKTPGTNLEGCRHQFTEDSAAGWKENITWAKSPPMSNPVMHASSLLQAFNTHMSTLGLAPRLAVLIRFLLSIHKSVQHAP